MLHKVKQNEIFALEDDINELNSIFRDLAILIHSQGDTIETIEDHVKFY